MKKSCCFVLAFIMCFGMTVSAANLDFLDNDYTRYESYSEMTFVLNNPIEIIKALDIPDEISNVINLTGLLEELCNTKMTVSVKSNMSDDNKKGKISVEFFSTVPIKVNGNLKVTTEAFMGMWIDMDITDEDNPKISCIYALPSYDKYITMDLSQMMNSDPQSRDMLMQLLNTISDKETSKQLKAAMKKSLIKNADIKESKNIYTIKLDDEGAKNFLIEILGASYDLNEVDGSFEETFKDEIDMLNDLKLFGDDGITIVYELDSKGNILIEDTKVHIDLNVYDIMQAYGNENDAITKENGRLNVSINQKTQYQNVGEDVEVPFPQLTEENSMDYSGLFSDYEYESPYQYFEIYTNGYYRADDGSPYLGVRDVIYAYGFGENDISYDNGTLTIVNPGLEDETFNTVTFYEGSNKIDIDGVEYELDNPVIMINGKICVDDSFVEKVFNCVMSYATYYFDSDMTNCDFERENPNYIHEDYGYPEDYCWHYQEFYIYSNGYYRADDGSPYLGVRDVLYAYGFGENDIIYDNGTLTIVNPGLGDEKFNTVTFYEGGDIVNIDGVEYKLDNPVMMVNDRICVDDSFVEIVFNCVMNYASYSYFYDEINCYFQRKDPNCPHDI